MNPVTKKITLNLIGLESNAFAILGVFHVQAKRERWTEDEINSVMAEATAGNYEHLLGTMANYCDNSDNGHNSDHGHNPHNGHNSDNENPFRPSQNQSLI